MSTLLNPSPSIRQLFTSNKPGMLNLHLDEDVCAIEMVESKVHTYLDSSLERT